MGLFSRKPRGDEALLDRSKERYVDRSTVLLQPTRGGDAAISPRVMHAQLGVAMAWPVGVDRGARFTYGKEVGDAYCKLFQAAIDDGFGFALTLEDDMIPPLDVVARLHAALDEAPVLAAVSALYRTREPNGRALILGSPEIPGDTTAREVGEKRGLVEVNAIPMGCALWRLSMFADVPRPWFVTEPHATQDVHFCLRARERGFRFAVDTRIECGHHDRATDTTY